MYGYCESGLDFSGRKAETTGFEHSVRGNCSADSEEPLCEPGEVHQLFVHGLVYAPGTFSE